MKATLRRLTVAWGVLNVIALCLVFMWPIRHLSSPTIGAVTLVSIAGQIVVRTILRLYRPDRSARPSPSDAENAAELERVVNSRVPLTFDVEVLTKLLLEQRKYRLRTTENIEIARKGVSRNVSVTWRLPSSKKKLPRPIPTLLIVKGTLLHNLEMRDNTGAIVAVVPYDLSLGMVAEAWQHVAATQARRAKKRGIVLSTGAVDESMRDGIGLISRTLPSSAKGSSATLQTRASLLVTEWEARNPEFASADRLLGGVARAYLSQLVCHYVLMAVTETGGSTTSFSLSYTTDYYSGLPRPNPKADLGAWFARKIGRVPPSLGIEIDTAYQSRSYHLQLSLPDGDHFSQGLLVDSLGRRLRKKRLGKYAGHQGYFRRSQLGRQALHLYTRLFHDMPPATLFVRVNEAPAFTLASSVAFCVICNAVLWGLVSWSSSSTDIEQRFAIIVSIPIGLLGALFAFRPPLRRSGIAISLVGSSIFLASGILMLLGIAGVLDREASWVAQLSVSFDQFWGTHVSDAFVMTRTTYLHSVAKALTIVALIGLGFLFVRCAAWISHYSADRRGSR